MTGPLSLLVLAVVGLVILLIGALLVNHLQRKKIALLEKIWKEEAARVTKWREENHRVRQALLKLASPSAVTTSHETREGLKKLLKEML